MHSNSMQNRNIIIGILAFIGTYLLVGALLFFHGTERIVNQVPADMEDGIGITANTVLSQRLIGNDEYLRSIEIPILSCEMGDDAEVNVFLTQGTTDCVSGDVLQIDTFSGSDLKEASCIRLDYSRIKQAYCREYYINIGLSKDPQGQVILALADSDVPDGLIFCGDVCYGISFAYHASYFSHDSMPFFFWKLFGFFALISVAIAFVLKQDFLRSLGYGTIFIWLLVLLIAYLDRFAYLPYCMIGLIVLSACYLVFLLVQYLRGKQITMVPKVKCSVFLSQMLIWVVFIAFWAICDRNFRAEAWDELYHWAVYVKDLYLYDRLPIHNKALVELYRYPPAYSGFQYLMMKINGRFADNILLFARHVLEMHLFLGAVGSAGENRDDRNVWQNVLLLLIAAVIPLPFISEIANYTLADVSVAFMLGAIFVERFRYAKEKKRISLVLLFVMSMLLYAMKDTAAMLLVSWLCGEVLMLLWGAIKKRDSALQKENLKAFASMACGLLLSFAAWRTCLRQHMALLEAAKASEKTTQEAATAAETAVESAVEAVSASAPSLYDKINSAMAGMGVSLDQLLDYLTGKGKPYQYEIIWTHIKYLAVKGYVTICNAFAISPLLFTILVIGICIFLNHLLGVKKGERIADYDFTAKLIASGVVFLCLMHVAYTFVMSEADAVRIYCEERYLGCYFMAVLVFLVYFYLQCPSSLPAKKRNRMHIVTIVVTLVLVGGAPAVFSLFYSNPYDGYANEFAIYQIRQYVPFDEKVYCIGAGETGGGSAIQYLRYNIDPILTNLPKYGVGPDGYKKHCFMPGLTGEMDLKEELRDYQYLYVESFDDRFVQEYGQYLDGFDAEEKGVLYRICKSDEDVSLEYVVGCRS